jgi:hypothetical protein
MSQQGPYYQSGAGINYGDPMVQLAILGLLAAIVIGGVFAAGR